MRVQMRMSMAAAVAAALWIPLSGRAADTPAQAAALAWDRGDYVTALTSYLQILDSPAAEAELETIALQTGELFQTTELTPNGESPQFSTDGRYIAYLAMDVPGFESDRQHIVLYERATGRRSDEGLGRRCALPAR